MKKAEAAALKLQKLTQRQEPQTADVEKEDSSSEKKETVAKKPASRKTSSAKKTSTVKKPAAEKKTTGKTVKKASAGEITEK